jgi:hypothetical protein
LFSKQRSLVGQEGIIDLEDTNTFNEEHEGLEDPELATILEESRVAAAKKVQQERLLKTGSLVVDLEPDIKIKIRVYWEWAFAFIYVYQLGCVYPFY